MGIQQILAGGAPVIAAPGQIVFSQAGTHSWTAPAGVSAVSVVCVGGGGGGAGGDGARPTGGGGGAGLGYKNNYAVNGGSSYTVVVGDGGTVKEKPPIIPGCS